MTGATGKAVLLKEVIDPAKDWTTSEGGDKLIDFLTLSPEKNIAPQDLQFELELIYTIGKATNRRPSWGIGKSWVAGEANPNLEPPIIQEWW